MNSVLIGLLAGLCTALGAVILFIKRNWTNKSLGFFLGLASGVMVAVVLFDMLPSALVFAGMKKTLTGFLIGVLVLWLFNRLFIGTISGKKSFLGLGYLIMLGIALHDLPEGMAIALGSEMKERTAMVIALAIGIHNIPEGMAIAAPLIMGGLRKANIFIKTLLIGLITPLGTIIGKIAIFVVPDLLPLLLGFASGIMIYLVLFQLWPQASNQDNQSKWWGAFLGILIILMATFI